MRRQLRWVPGETMIACSICGLPCLFPSESRRLSDANFYCYRHVEYRTGECALDNDRRTAEAMKRRDTDMPALPAPRPSWR